MKRVEHYTTIPSYTPTEGVHLVSPNGTKRPCKPSTTKVREEEDSLLGVRLGATKRPLSVTACSSSSLPPCLLSLEPDARGAGGEHNSQQQKRGTRDVRVWWPTAAKHNYLMQSLGHGWKHAYPTVPTERSSRKDVWFPSPTPKPPTHSARTINLKPPSEQVVCFTLSITRQATCPLPSPQRCPCERPSCLQILCDAHEAIKRWGFFVM